MDDLLIKYMHIEATPEESHRVQQWLAANDAHRTRFNSLQAVWQLAAQPNLQLATDTPQALQRLKQTLRARETAPIKRIWPRMAAAAAAMVGIAAIVVGAYVLMKPKNTIKEQAPIVLPDTVLQRPMQVDTAPSVPKKQPAPDLHRDTIPFVKRHKKKLPAQVKPASSLQPKKKALQKPTQPTDATPAKKKRPSIKNLHS